MDAGLVGSDGPAIRDGPVDLAGIRVAMFTGNYNYLKEGANQALNKLVRHLQTRVGGEVRIYSPVTDTPAFEPEGTLVPVPSVPLPGRSEFRLALGLPAAARADVKAFAPDLVHVATPDILSTRAQTFAMQLGVPVVASVHTRFETYLDYYRLGMLRPLVQWHLDRFYRRSDMVLVPTPSMIGEMAPKLGADRLRVWGRGVDTQLFDPSRRNREWRRAHGIGEDEVALLFFGRIVLEKGIDCFARTVNLLRGRGLPCKVVIVGEGPARTMLSGLLPDAIFAGHLAGVELATAVASADVLLNPSLTETFGNVTLEAMAAGLPVVAADAPSTANLIEDGVTGLIASPDAERFADCAARVIEDTDFRWKLALAARSSALAWKWDAVLDTVLESYRVTLERAGRQPR
ncbi:MAG: glycosyltransferase family 1 protein [Novosphingobium sp.]|nr:glycosyltransferase family 1 protein [Novosphingobium sp.]MCB2078387.1 glycosyltransferase family 1 protein [Novosphingobium sp.]